MRAAKRPTRTPSLSNRDLLCIEAVEPRLLLSGTTLTTAAAQAVAASLHDNIGHLESVLSAVELYDKFGNATPLVDASGQGVTTIGQSANITKQFDAAIVDPIQTFIDSITPGSASYDASKVPADTGALASELDSLIKDALGITDGSVHVVTDASASGNVDLKFAFSNSTNTSVSLTLGESVSDWGISFPNSLKGSLDVDLGFNFEVAIADFSTSTLADTSFTLVNASLTATLTADATLPAGLEINLGVLSLDVGGGSTMHFTGEIDAAFAANVSHADLADDAALASGGDSDFLGTGGFFTINVVSETVGTGAAPLLDFVVSVAADSEIPGLPALSGSGHIQVTGSVFDGDWTTSITGLDPIEAFGHLQVADIVNLLGQLGDYLGSLTGSPLMDVTIPFTDGTTIGDVLDFAADFKASVIDKLGPVNDTIGFTQNQTATAADGSHTAVLDIVPSDLSGNPLPSVFHIEVKADGKIFALEVHNDEASPLTTLDALADAINTALTAAVTADASLAGILTVSTVAASGSDPEKLEFAAVATGSDSQPASVALNAPAASFNNIVEFGQNLAQALGYGDDLASIATFLADIGLSYDSASSSIVFKISYAKDLPIVTGLTLGTGFDLGEVASLSGSGTLDLSASVGFSLAVGFNLGTLGGSVTVDGASIGTGTIVTHLPAWTSATATETDPAVTADQIKGGTGNTDLLIFLRDGTTGTIEFQVGTDASPGDHFVVKVGAATTTIDGSGTDGAATIADLLSAIATIEPGKVSAIYNASTMQIEVHDNSTKLGTNPATLGFSVGQGVSATQLTSGAHSGEYQAVVLAAVSDSADYTAAMDFLLTLGSLDPIKVHLDADGSRTTASAFAGALNTLFAGISVDPTKLGLSASHSAIHYSDLLSADAVGGTSGNQLEIKTTMYNVVSATGTTSAERSAAKFGVSLNAVDLLMWATNGSQFPVLLGIIGLDVNGLSDAEGLVVGSALHNENLTDRFFFDDTGIVGSIALTLSDLVLTGSLGFLGFSAEGSGFVSLATSLMLQSPDGGSQLTLHDLQTAYQQGTLNDIWAFKVGAPTDGAPWAELDITGVTITGSGGTGSVIAGLAGAIAPGGVSISIVFDNPLNGLSDFLHAAPKVTVDGLDNLVNLEHLSASDIVAGLRVILETIDNNTSSSILDTNLPLIDVSVNDVLDYAQQFLTVLDQLQNNPAAAVDQFDAVLKSIFGSSASVSLDASGNMIVGLSYQPLSVREQLPFSIDLATLAQAMGITDLPSEITSLVSASGSGLLEVTAAATLSVALGIRIAPTPASSTTTLTSLNNGSRLRGDGTAAPDLLFTLGGGTQFTVDVDALAANATIGDLLTAITAAADAAAGGGGHLTAVIDGTGEIVLTDSGTVGSAALGLTDLGFDTGTPANLVAATSGSNLVLSTGALPASGDYDKAFAFNLVVDGTTIEIDVGANATRTTADGLVTAINQVLATTVIDKSILDSTTSGATTLGDLITVSQGSGHLTFTAVKADLGAAAALFVADLPAAPLGLSDLGFGASSVVATDDAMTHVQSVTATLPGASDPSYAEEFKFAVSINGHAVDIDVAADAGRTTASGLVSAINFALGTAMADRHDLGFSGSGKVLLGQLVTASLSGTTLTFSATDARMPTGLLFTIEDAPSATPSLTLRVADLSDAGIAALLGFDSGNDTVHADSGVDRVLTGSALEAATDSERFFIDTTHTGVTLSLGVQGSNLTFQTQLGPLSASIDNGTATLGAETALDGGGAPVAAGDPSFHVGSPSTDPATISFTLKDGTQLHISGDTAATAGRLYFSEIDAVPSLGDLVSFESNVAVQVDLPVSVFGVPLHPDISIEIGNALGGSSGWALDPDPWTVNVVLPDFNDSFSIVSFLNNPQAIINGLDNLLGTLDTLFTQQVFGYQLPLIGGAIAKAGDFIGDLRSDIVGYLQGLLDDYQASHPGETPTTADLVSDGIEHVLSLLGFTGTVTNFVDTQLDGGEIVFDMHAVRELFSGTVDLSADFGIPGLGLQISNGQVNLAIDVDIDIGFGFSIDKGFFLEDSLAAAHALALTFAVTIPSGFSAGLNLGILTATATNLTTTTFTNADGSTSTGTSLSGGFYVDLHPKSNSTLADLGVTRSDLVGVESGGSHVITVTLPDDVDYTSAFAFQVVVDGTAVSVSLAADALRSSGASFASAVTAALSGHHVTAAVSGSTLTLTASDSDLGSDPQLALRDVPLTFAKIGSSIHIELGANLNVDLLLAARTDFGLSVELPSISTEFLFQYQFDKVLVGSGSGESGILIPVTFKDITIDAGSFLSGFLLPILDTAWDIIQPIMPILDFITDPLPGISDIVGRPVSLLDIAQLIGGYNPEVKAIAEAIEIIDEVANLIRTVEQLKAAGGSEDLRLDFGTYSFGTATIGPLAGHGYSGSIAGLASGGFDPFSGDSLKKASLAASTISSQLPGVLGTAVSGLAANALSQISNMSSSSSSDKGKFTLPILENPLDAIKLLTGQITGGIDLIKWKLPDFTFVFNQHWHFPVVGIPGINIGADLGLNITASLRVTFGYDTTGIEEFLDTHNPLFIFDGFYVDDTLGPQISASAVVSAGASIDLSLIKAGITGQIGGSISFQLSDPNHDGKVRPTEILSILLDNPLDLFVIHGEIDARIYAWWWVGLDLGFFGTITLFSGEWDILGPLTLLRFDYVPFDHPILGTQTNGVVTLNAGSLGDQRIGAGSTTGPETFSVDGTGGHITVHYNGASQSFSSVSQITADFGESNMNIVMSGDITVPIVFTGGGGTNVIDLRSVSDPTITLGDGDNIIYLGAGPNVVTVGNGNNTIIGGDGDDTITVGEGNNYIEGGGGADVIKTGSGNNTIIGGAGENIITVGSGNNLIIGGQGTATATLLSASASTDGNNTITAGSGKNIIIGGSGNDIIKTTGGGNNIVLGDLGSVVIAPTETVTVSGATSATIGGTVTGGDTVTLKLDNSHVDNGPVSAAYSVVSGDTVTDIASGLASAINANSIFSAAGITATASGGVVTISGATSVAGYVGGSADVAGAITATSSVGGSDQITTGSGDDIIVGGAGADTIVAGNGYNIVLGDTGTVDGPRAGSGGHFTIAGTNDGTGNDTITGGVYADVIIGGSGNDRIDAGSGNDIVAGDDATVVRTGALGSAAALVSATATPDGSTGADSINGGTGNDIILGGGGADTIDGGSGQNVMLGDYGVVVPVDGINPDVVGTDADHASNGADTITAGLGANVVMGGGGDDVLDIGAGSNIAFGDVGEVTRAPTTLALKTADTTAADEQYGGNDTITVDAGSNIVFGGAGNDLISSTLSETVTLSGTTGATIGGTVTVGETVVLIIGNASTAGTGVTVLYTVQAGDDLAAIAAGLKSAINANSTLHGAHITATSSGTVVTVTGATSLQGSENVMLGDFGVATAIDGINPDVVGRDADKAYSGSDTIVISGGTNVVMGGGGADSITLGGGSNIAFGDNGTVTRSLSTLSVVDAETVEESYGGDDVIDITGGDTNAVLGGAGADTITVSASGDNILLGDLGIIKVPDGTIFDVLAHDYDDGGRDTITVSAGADGANTIFGGGDIDHIRVLGNGANLVFGDDGEVKRDAATLARLQADTAAPEPAKGADDVIDIGDVSHVVTGRNTVLGGHGTDTITVYGSGDNILIGDLGKITVPDGTNPDIQANDFDDGSVDTITVSSGADGANMIFGGGGADVVTIDGNGANLVFGDNGQVTRDGTTFARLVAQTDLTGVADDEEAKGADDRVTVNGDGRNSILGGAGTDTLTVNGDGDNVLLGDMGMFKVPAATKVVSGDTNPMNVGDGLVGDIVNGPQASPSGTAADIVGRHTTIGAADTITISSGADGDNIAMGETGDDIIITDGAGVNIIFGDTAEVTREATTLIPLYATTAENDLGGKDTITASVGTNYIFGGQDKDTIHGGSGADYIVGDDGYILFTTSGVHSELRSTRFAYGNDDVITTGDGDNVVIGGTGSDTITGGAARDTLIGDQGVFNWYDDGARHFASTLTETPALGASDTINGGGGNDNLIGGKLGDLLVGGDGSDIIIGDDGRIWFKNDQEWIAESVGQFYAGPDVLYAGADHNFLMGGGPVNQASQLNNLFYADPLNDLIMTGDGHIELSGSRVASWTLPPFLTNPIISPTGNWFRYVVPDDDASFGIGGQNYSAHVEFSFGGVQHAADHVALVVVDLAQFGDAANAILNNLLSGTGGISLPGGVFVFVEGASATLLGVTGVGTNSLSVILADNDDDASGAWQFGSGSLSSADSHAIVTADSTLLPAALRASGGEVVTVSAEDGAVTSDDRLVRLGHTGEARREASASVEMTGDGTDDDGEFFVFDAASGSWTRDDGASGGPRLVIHGQKPRYEGGVRVAA